MSAIEFISRKRINDEKWNTCVQQADNSLPYALCWYLDAVAENWDALVLNDYEAVMPLVWLRKLGVRCLYQPYFCQQLGVFGRNISAETQKQFLQEATEKFPYTHINLNSSAIEVMEEFNLKPKKNLLLELNCDYTSLQKNFSENHRRNISKAQKLGLIFGEIEAKLFKRFYLKHINRKQQNFKTQHEKIFNLLLSSVEENQAGVFYSVADASGNIEAALLLLRHQNRLINIINISSEEGKKSGASHFLFSRIIQKYAAHTLSLDFEGSSIPSIARFYEGFGAQPENFFLFQTNIFRKLSQRFS